MTGKRESPGVGRVEVGTGRGESPEVGRVAVGTGERESPEVGHVEVGIGNETPPGVGRVEMGPAGAESGRVGGVETGKPGERGKGGKTGKRAKTRKRGKTRKARSFRVGRVRVYPRGRVWYLCYWENGKRKRPRAGPDRDAARRLAAEINAQLETGVPSLLGFERVGVAELRERWLDRHEKVLRSSVNTIRRYRAATEHLVRFMDETHAAGDTSRFTLTRAEEFVGYLRSVRVSPNGHPKTKKRGLRDKGVLFIVEACRAMFNYAAKHRMLPPYAENPFASLTLSKMPVEDAKPIRLFTPDEERRFLEACDDWQFPVFATLIMTGLRPGELVHLLLPDDLDLDAGLLFVRNKSELGWQVKTRSERELPLHPVLADVLRDVVGAPPAGGDRAAGPVFARRPLARQGGKPSGGSPAKSLSPGRGLPVLVARREAELGRALSRDERLRLARKAWWAAGALTNEIIRREFMKLTRKIGLPDVTTPKTLRHMFATGLQEVNVDPLIRMELMGHSPLGSKASGPLGMTTVYTHTRPETRRKQLLAALERRPCVAVALERARQDEVTTRAG